MITENVVSLRRFKAHRIYRKYIALPSVLRTPERTEGVLAAIVDYAWEHVGTDAQEIDSDADYEQTRTVSKKLVEFMPAVQSSDSEEMMQWLHENLVPEAWDSPEYLKDFLHECLRHG